MVDFYKYLKCPNCKEYGMYCPTHRKSVVIDDNNKIINEEPYDTPTTVFVVDDSSGMLYRLNGFISMDDLLQIAKSLK